MTTDTNTKGMPMTSANGTRQGESGQPDNGRALESTNRADEWELWLEWRSEQPRRIYDDPALEAASWNERLREYREARRARMEQLGVRTLADLEEAPIEWLWEKRVPRGEVTIIEGDPETGKTTVASEMAACVTQGRRISPDDAPKDPGDVLLVATEDSISKSILPQLRVHRADVSRVHEMQMKTDDEGNPVPLAFPRDVQRMRESIEEFDVKLVVVSPITACLGEETNTNNDASLRRALTPVAQVAQETGAAMVLLRHLNKDESMKALYRGGGSIAFMGVSRTALVTGEHEGQRAVAMVKNNLYDKRAVDTLAFDLLPPPDEQVPRVRWSGSLPITAEDLVNPDGRKKAPRRDEAMALLRELLDGQGWMPTDRLQEEMKKGGFNQKTWDAAAEKLGVTKHREQNDDGTTRKWWWSL